MSLWNPRTWFGGGGQKRPGVNMTARESAAQGPYTSVLSHYVLREAAPYLYEALREAVPTLDGAVDKVVMLDGMVELESDSDALVREFNDWAEGVRVNDFQEGLQTFYELQGNEMYEQGLTIGDWQLSDNGRDVERLWVADSKGIYFRRPPDGAPLEVWYRPPAPDRTRKDGTTQVERILRNNYQTGDIMRLLRHNGYRQLDPSSLIYASFRPEADNPYGTSIFRSMPFVARILLTMDNALLQTWERFGNPSFSVMYKTNNRALSGDENRLEARRATIAEMFNNAMTAKRQGNSVDFVNAIGKDDELQIDIIGAVSETLTIEQPGRHVQEQMVSKFPVPSWMLGFHWSTAERLAQRQGEMALQESRTRFAKRKPALKRLVETMFRARGITWNQGDWDLEQDLPSLQDLVAQAQARFLDAQTEQMQAQAGLPTNPPVIDDDGKFWFPGDPGYRRMLDAVKQPRMEVWPARRAGVGGLKVESFAENGAVLSNLEGSALGFLHGAWTDLADQLIAKLGLPSGKAARKTPEGAVFTFDAASLLRDVLDMGDGFVNQATQQDKQYIQSLIQSWTAGTALAMEQDNLENAITDQARGQVADSLHQRGLEMARYVEARAFRNDIVQGLVDGLYDGMNRADVTRALRQRFDINQPQWDRLVQTEMTMAHADGKMAQFQANGLEMYDYMTAGDSKVSEICRTLAAGGPYRMGEGPIPGRDSHPRCRCSVSPYIED